MSVSTTSPRSKTVFAPPEATADRERMRRAHAGAAATLTVRAHGRETWGFKGRTLSRRAGEGRWLRVVATPLDKPRGITWDGTARADTLLPRSVPRPRLHDVFEWTDTTHLYRAELSEHVPRPALQAGGPVLTRELDLPDTWWADLRDALAVTATVPTHRQAVRQQWIDRHFSRLLGIPTVPVTSWTTGHGDLHFGNLLGPPLVIIDWEGFGRMPSGFDAGLLHAYSLTMPATADRIRAAIPDVFGTQEGHVGELVALAQLLQVSERGGHPELTPHLARRAEQLSGVPVPLPPALAL
ncbi:aminoglycoside phosphotransferase family protein [Streptomyces arboris]|nr:phosphotransferase [Streptomyces arboris]